MQSVFRLAARRADAGLRGPTVGVRAGEPLRPGLRPTRGQTDWVADFIQQQPFAAVLVALVAGYVWGKIS